MTPLPLLLNTSARSAHGQALRAWLARHPGRFDIIEPSSPEDMTAQAARLASLGRPIVAVAGGDGTLSRAARGLAGTSSAMAAIPSGTMNVFARELGIGSHDFDSALAAIDGGCVQSIDLFRAGEAVFLQMAGFGFDARAVEHVSPGLKKLCGGLAYGLSGLLAAFRTRDRLTLCLKGGERYPGSAILIGNGRYYGGSFPLFGAACSGDGLLDAIIFHGGVPSMLGEVATALFTRGISPPGNRAYTYIQAESCTIESAAVCPYELDGDFSGHVAPAAPLQLTPLAGGLRVCVPPRTPAALKGMTL